MTLPTYGADKLSASHAESKSARPSAPAILMVSMEPPASMAEEFNDWYDTEHFPQRSALPGVYASSRWVCLDGWPRWMALYELHHAGVLQSDAYHAMSGPHATPWSKRILPRTIGRTRIVAQQCRRDPDHPSSMPPAAPIPTTRIARLLVMSVPLSDSTVVTDHPAESHALNAERIGAVVRDRLSARPELLQLRTFVETTQETGQDSAQDKTTVWLIAAFDTPVNVESLMREVGRPAGYGVPVFNLYAPYCRGG